jgi:hypothetical protein
MNKRKDQPHTIVSAAKLSLPAAKEVAVDMGEVALDAIMEDGIAKDLPLVGWAFKAYGVVEAFQQAKLKRNAMAFLQAFDVDDVDKLAHLDDRMYEDKVFQRDFTDAVGAVLMESVKPMKAAIAGRLVKALSNEHLSRQQFDDLMLTLHHASVPALKSFAFFVEESGGKAFIRMKHSTRQSAIGCLMGLGFATQYGTHVNLTHDARLFWQYGLGNEPFSE